MIKYTTKDGKNKKIIHEACKKLGLEEDGVTFAAYDKFLFAFVFALAIKGDEIHLLATDEGGKKEGVRSTYPLSRVKGVMVEKKTDVNLFLDNGKFINLTSAVGVAKGTKHAITAMNDAILNKK